MKVVVVISGSIASGKSTLARAVAGSLEAANVRAAVIDLDVVHASLGIGISDIERWQLARRRAAALADVFLAADVEVVVVDGEFITPEEREALIADLVAAAAVGYVTLRTTYDEALRRALGDDTRGLSRDPVFLRAHYDAVAAALDATPVSDLVVNTATTPLDSAVDRVTALISRLRAV